MPEKKMKNIKRELIEQKLNLVVEKLMNLGGPENEAELKDGGEAIGFFKRDFGIAEWDWPQGVVVLIFLDGSPSAIFPLNH